MLLPTHLHYLVKSRLSRGLLPTHLKYGLFALLLAIQSTVAEPFTLQSKFLFADAANVPAAIPEGDEMVVLEEYQVLAVKLCSFIVIMRKLWIQKTAIQLKHSQNLQHFTLSGWISQQRSV